MEGFLRLGATSGSPSSWTFTSTSSWLKTRITCYILQGKQVVKTP